MVSTCVSDSCIEMMFRAAYTFIGDLLLFQDWLKNIHSLSLVWSYSVYICQNAFEDVLLLNFIKEKCPKLKKNSEKSKEDFFRKSAGKHCVISKPYIWLVEKRTILAVLYFRSQYCTLWLKESPWYKKIEIYWSKIN